MFHFYSQFFYHFCHFCHFCHWREMLGDDSYLRFFCIRIFELAPPPLVFDSPPSLLKTYNESSANVVLGTIFRADRVARYDGALLAERRGRTRSRSVELISLDILSHYSHSCLRHHHFFTLVRRRSDASSDGTSLILRLRRYLRALSRFPLLNRST